MERLERPLNLFRPAIQFVEVLGGGEIWAEVRTRTGGMEKYRVGLFEHLFFRSDVEVTWRSHADPSGIVGVVIYLQ